MTVDPETPPTPEELAREIELRLDQPSWSPAEFLLRVSGLCWVIFALALGVFVPLGQIGSGSAPEIQEGPRKETIRDLNEKTVPAFTTQEWAIWAISTVFIAAAGWGMLRGKRWGAVLGGAGSLIAIAWLVAGAWSKTNPPAGSGTWGLVLFASLLLAIAPASAKRCWWALG